MTTICVRELQLVLVFPAIGCESGLSFLNQSQGEVMQKTKTKVNMYYFGSQVKMALKMVLTIRSDF